jgi:hypothetical protein
MALLQNERKLLTDTSTPETDLPIDPTHLSPTGHRLMEAKRLRVDAQRQINQMRVNQLQASRELERISNEMQAKMEAMEENMFFLQTYLRGVKHMRKLCQGPRAPREIPYRVFQTRQFLDKEVALFGNFKDFDFQKVDDFDRWIVKSGFIWRLLPFEKCILITRLRRERKHYYGKSAIENYYLNLENFDNHVWIRNGQEVVRLKTDIDFANAAFPDEALYKQIHQFVAEYVWKEDFSPHSSRSRAFLRDDYNIPKPGLKEKPELESEPMRLAEVEQRRFATFEAWLESEEYKLHAQREINDAVSEYVHNEGRRQFAFLLFLQGMVDTSQLLDIPAGSDLFNPVVYHDYFELIADYTNGISDNTLRDKIQAYQDVTRIATGTFVLVQLPAKSALYKSPIRLFELRRDNRGAEKGSPYVLHYPRRKHYPYHPVKTPEKLYLTAKVDDSGKVRRHAIPVVSTQIPLDLTQKILDDREWKMNEDNHWLVPLFVRWESFRARYFRNPVENTVIDDGGEDE